MWRNYVICVLIGLLIAVTVSSIVLLRQTQTTQSDLNSLRQRAVAAEATSSSLQQQVDQRSRATPTTAASGNASVGADATPASAASGNAIVRADTTPTP